MRFKVVASYRSLFLLCTALVLALSGCSIQMQHDALAPAPANRQGDLHVHQQAENIVPFKRVGWGRGTMFAIPFVPIYVQGDASLLLVEQVNDALIHAGYSPRLVDAHSLSDEQKNLPVLKVAINKYRFSNYTYLFPLVPTWGSTDVTLSLHTHEGHPLWQSDFEAGGSTLNFFNGYTSASRKSITRVLNKMVTAFSGDDFFLAITQPDQARADYLQRLQNLLNSEHAADHHIGTQLLAREPQPDQALLNQAAALMNRYDRKASKTGGLIQLSICNTLERLQVSTQYRSALETTAKQSKNSKARACAQKLVR